MEPRICPICLRLITPEENLIEFSDFPGVTYHEGCVERLGVTETRKVLAEHYPRLMAEAEAEAEADDDEEDDGEGIGEEEASDDAADSVESES